MKRNAKQNGSGGRLRLALFAVSAALFLLVPVAAASAATLTVDMEGSGDGKVITSTDPFYAELQSTPPIECEYIAPGPKSGTCTATAANTGANVARLVAEPFAGSEFKEWILTSGTVADGCGAGELECGIFSFGATPITAKAVFVAKPNVHITIEGSGSGTVIGQEDETGEEDNIGGNPRVECDYVAPGPQTGVCDTLNGTTFGGALEGVVVEQEAAAGSEFVEWILEEGNSGGAGFCEAGSLQCSAYIFGAEEVKITAVFAALPTFALNLTTSGSGSGSFECDTGSGPEACQSSYLAGTEVTVSAAAATGSEFVEFSGDCSGSSCELTMDAEKSVDAQFDLEQVPFTTEVEGEGTVLCNGEPCAASYAYGTVIGVTATPAAENVLLSLTGSGSLEGACNKETETCTETAIIEPSGVKAVFAGAKTVAQQVENVHGEVPETTELATSCGNDVDLGIFTPGVENRYWYVCNLTVTSTGEESELRAKDETGFGEEGHLSQKPKATVYNLPEPLEMTAESTIPLNGVPNGGLEPLDAGGVTLMSYPTPVSVDSVDAEFSQWIRTHDPLHTGVYSKEITLTLEQTEP